MTRDVAPLSTCPGCGIQLPAVDGPVHRYMESSPACWARYGELLARDYTDPAYRAVHRLIVDSFAVQHPGRPSPQSSQSVAVHLMSLQVILERGWDFDRARRLLSLAADRGPWAWLTPPATPPALTLLHPLACTSASAHGIAAWDWARAAWDHWRAHHDQVRAWAESIPA